MKKAAAYAKNNPNLRQPKMSHIRHIKPEYFQHEGVAELQPFARLAWIGLWTNCDKHGRFEWKPKSLKIKILPFDNLDFEALLLELEAHGFVVRYEVAGQQYGYIPNWSKHQFIGTREKQSPVSSHSWRMGWFTAVARTTTFRRVCQSCCGPPGVEGGLFSQIFSHFETKNGVISQQSQINNVFSTVYTYLSCVRRRAGGEFPAKRLDSRWRIPGEEMDAEG